VTLSRAELEGHIVYSDGACSGNPGKGGWGTIVVSPDGNVVELGGGERETTNNRMEMMGAIQGLEALRGKPGSVLMLTDSTYVIRGITQWVWGWRNRGWKTVEGNDVQNRELWERLVRASVRKDGKIDWRYVRGHVGIAGNERVDEIAVAFTKGKRIDLYRGPLLGYGVAVHDLPEAEDLPEPKPKAAKAAAYSYLSLVDGVPMRHSNWPDCERRVKGRSGARFKKAVSEDDERAILSSWGVVL
jgi:ribonuclease HI